VEYGEFGLPGNLRIWDHYHSVLFLGRTRRWVGTTDLDPCLPGSRFLSDSTFF